MAGSSGQADGSGALCSRSGLASNWGMVPFHKDVPSYVPLFSPLNVSVELSPRYGWRIINAVVLWHISPSYKVVQRCVAIQPLIHSFDEWPWQSVLSIKAKPTHREGNENTWKTTQLIGMRHAPGHEVHFILSGSSVSVCRLTHSPHTCLNDSRFKPELGRKLTCAILIDLQILETSIYYCCFLFFL